MDDYSNATCGSLQKVECEDVNATTCELMPRPENHSFEVLVEEGLGYDNDSCFFMNPFRQTPEYKAYEQFSLVIGLLTLAFGGLGLVGNFVSIVVLVSKDMRSNCFNNILTALNITDSLHIVFAILEVLRVDFAKVYNYFLPHSFFPYFHYPAYRIFLCASIYLIMAVGVERYLAVCRPHHYREVQARANRAATYISLALVGALAVCLPRFFEVESVTHCIDFSHCNMSCPVIVQDFHKVTEVRMNLMYITFYHFWFWILATGIAPFLILSVLNYRIYNAMKTLKRRLTSKPRPAHKQINGSTTETLLSGLDKAGKGKRKKSSVASQQQKKECNLATVLITTTLTFWLLHMPRVFTSLYEALNVQNQMTCERKGMDYLPLWFLYSIVVMNILLVLNASSNFLIYLFAGNSFRDQFKRIFALSRSGSNEVFCLGSLPLPGKNLFSRKLGASPPVTGVDSAQDTVVSEM